MNIIMIMTTSKSVDRLKVNFIIEETVLVLQRELLQ